MSVSSGDAPGDKYVAVNRMFSRISGSYDHMNALISFGLDGWFRRRAAGAAAVPAGGTALDIGTGTGDLAFAVALGTKDVHVVGLDYTTGMLDRAPAKARRRGLGGATSWVRADGLRSPFREGEFDAVLSAFVLRNLVDLGAAFSEMRRVVRPGGRVVSLEMSPDGAPVWRDLFAAYFGIAVPVLGQLVAGDRSAYEYLPRSVAAFLTPPAVADVMSGAGLVPLRPIQLMLGSVVIHIGARPT